jgi:hypothetical protein
MNHWGHQYHCWWERNTKRMKDKSNNYDGRWTRTVFPATNQKQSGWVSNPLSLMRCLCASQKQNCMVINYLFLCEIWVSHGSENDDVLGLTPCGLIGRGQCFEEVHCLHLQPWRRRQYVSPKNWYLPMSPHGITTQKSNIVTYS